jgi:two-component system, OmpR family, response regulator VicR
MSIRLLVIEDDRQIAEIVRDFLVNEGYEVKLIHSGEKAVKAFDSFLPHLLIIDIMLPDGDGVELCRQFRNRSDLPIIMLSAKDGDIDKILSLGLGADDYMTKPFSPTELVARVKAHLRRYLQMKENGVSALQFDHLQIDEQGFAVYLRGKKVSLAQKEFEILLLLAKNKGTLFTKEQIYDQIWGVDEYGEISTVTVHIRRIRKKIEDDPSNPIYIKTVWGVGYLFEGDI